MVKLPIVLLLVVCWQGCQAYAVADPLVLQDLLERVEHIQNVLMKRVYPAVHRVNEIGREVETIRHNTPDVSEILRRVQAKVESGAWKLSSAAKPSESPKHEDTPHIFVNLSIPINSTVGEGNLDLLHSFSNSSSFYAENISDGVNPSALHKAARLGQKDVVERLLASGAPPSVTDSQQMTPLHVAALWGHAEVASLLIKAGSRVNPGDIRGSTPLHEAASSFGGPAVVRVLLEADANVDAENNYSETPLHRAARWGNKDAIQLLIDAKANVNARTDVGITPLHECVEGSANPEPMVQMLLKAGANKHAKDFLNKTPKDVALRRNLQSLAEIL